jgi:nitrate reductase / nitrite oxidoreductase, alpha subunit
MTGRRGGIHNSVTRTVLKPTHMIGGYAQLSYGFNYYGTVGSNRDEFIIVRAWTRWTGWAERQRTSSSKWRRSRCEFARRSARCSIWTSVLAVTPVP